MKLSKAELYLIQLKFNQAAVVSLARALEVLLISRDQPWVCSACMMSDPEHIINHDEHNPGPKLHDLRDGDGHLRPDLVYAVAQVTVLQDRVRDGHG